MALKARIQLPERARPGEVIEIRAIVGHPMESGFRNDDHGRPIPRHIIESFTCTYAGEEVFRARFFPAIAANPYLVFHTVAVASGELVFTWRDDRGDSHVERAHLEVN